VIREQSLSQRHEVRASLARRLARENVPRVQQQERERACQLCV